MLAGSPGSSTTKQLGPLGERRAVGLPPLTRAHSGIHSRLFQSVPGPLPLPCPCPTWQRKGFLRCCDPILPLIKMLSDTIVVVWVSSLLVEGSARGMCSWRRWGRGGGGGRSSGFWSPAASACSSLPMSILQKRHTEMFRPFPREAGKAGESRLLRSAVGPFEYLRDHPRGTAPLRVFITSVLPAPRVIIHS